MNKIFKSAVLAGVLGLGIASIPTNDANAFWGWNDGNGFGNGTGSFSMNFSGNANGRGNGNGYGNPYAYGPRGYAPYGYAPAYYGPQPFYGPQAYRPATPYAGQPIQQQAQPKAPQTN